ncbi:MAG: T9SS type A sorting domain-containing protein [Calditrichaeota bacterium]|nr:T9SS type A sorting domain-containing protein [Calditrichota bacterium]
MKKDLIKANFCTFFRFFIEIAFLSQAAILPTTGLAQTVVRGEASGRWHADGNPYIIEEGANVPANEQLTISAGVHVMVRVPFIVNGAIHVEGAENDSAVIMNDPEVAEVFQLLHYTNTRGLESRFDHLAFVNTTGRLIYVNGACRDLGLCISNSRLTFQSAVRADADFDNITIEDCLITPGRGYLLQLGNFTESIDIHNSDIFFLQSLIGGCSDLRITGNLLHVSPHLIVDAAENVILRDNDYAVNGEAQNNQDEQSIINWRQNQPGRDWGTTNFECINNTFASNWQVGFGNGGTCIVENNDFLYSGCNIGGFSDTRIVNNTFGGDLFIGGEGDEESYIFESNRTLKRDNDWSQEFVISGNDFSPEVRNNDLGNCVLRVRRGATPNVHDNKFGLGFEVNDASPNIHHNVFGLMEKYIGSPNARFIHANDVVFANNVIISYLAEGNLIELSDNSSPLITSNVLYHAMDVRCNAFRSIGECDPIIRNNIIFGFESVFLQMPEQDSNLFVDPLFARSDPFDFRLQPNSPAIDAGDPDLPNDPDETRADIGPIFYDQSRNNRPCIISPAKILIGYGDTLTYIAKAVDESASLSFRFEDLPDWLQVVEHRRDYVADSITISGIVPEDEPPFEFFIVCEDDEGAVDTLSATVEVSNKTLLQGRIGGVLTRNRSPYWVIKPTWVEEGDSLIIEPGSIIYLNTTNYDRQPRPKPSLRIYGRLQCVGTAEDSIYFLGNEDVPGGAPYLYNSPDTSEYAYTKLQGSQGIYASFTNLIVHNCLFGRESGSGISMSSGWVKVFDNVFHNMSYMSISGRESHCEIVNNKFFNDTLEVYYDRWQDRYPACWFRNSEVYASSNYFRNQFGAYSMEDGGVFHSHRDILLTKVFGLNLDCDEASIDLASLSSTDYPPFTVSGRLSVRNSIFAAYDTTLFDSSDNIVEITLRDNLFAMVDTSVRELLDGFGLLSAVNVNGDSVDVYGNLFGDPGLIDIYPLEYRLGRSSRGIDAAISEDDERDPDGTLPDLGPVPFNHNNHPIEIRDLVIFPEMEVIVNEEIRCSVNYADEDENDSSAFQWDLYRIISRPDEEHFETIFLQTIGFSSEIGFIIESIGIYRLICVATDGFDLDTLFQDFEILPSSLPPDTPNAPILLSLNQNYPNPFNSTTIIAFDLPTLKEVKIAVYDICGREISILASGQFTAGRHFLVWKPTNLSSGVYFCQLQTSADTKTIPITLIR